MGLCGIVVSIVWVRVSLKFRLFFSNTAGGHPPSPTLYLSCSLALEIKSPLEHSRPMLSQNGVAQEHTIISFKYFP